MQELFTIGYAGTAQSDVLRTLLYYEIETLLDIRELPQSRKPGFSKKALGLAAADVGIKYAHLPALGTPRDIRYRRKIDNDFDAFREGFLEYLGTQDEAVLDLITRTESERCCLLCYEAEAVECHRWFVAERALELSGNGLKIIHLAVSQDLPLPSTDADVSTLPK